MTDNVDFKAAKEWARLGAARDYPNLPSAEVRNVSRAYLALCELLKEALPAVSHAQNMMADNDVAEAWVVLERRINAAIGE